MRCAMSDRERYLRDLADDYGLDPSIVIELAHMMGEGEDYDGLVSMVQDYACFIPPNYEE